jgi:hypothetical protein
MVGVRDPGQADCVIRTFEHEEAHMYARIATFQGEPKRLPEVIAANKKMIEASLDSPPKGLEGVKDLWMLVDRKNGRSLGITLFDSETELRRGDDALNSMSPAVDGVLERTGVDFYEVAYQHGPDRAPASR